MRLSLWLPTLLAILTPVAALAQGAAPPGAELKAAPAAKAPDAAKPSGNAPAAAATAPTAGNAPTTTPAPAAASGKKLTVRAPSGGDYTAYIQEAATAAPKSFQDNVDLELPSELKAATIYVLDNKSGYAARKSLTAGSIPAEITFAGPDFKLIQKVKVLATGKEGKPISAGMVTLTDGGKSATRKVLQASSNGTAEFEFVVSGVGSVSVAPEGGSATTKEVNLGLPAGDRVQSLEVAMPEVTNVLADAAPAGASAAAPAPGASTNTTQQTAAPTAAQPVQQLPPPPSGGGFGSNLIGWIFLILICGGIYLYCKKNGITIDVMLKKLGVQPDTVVQGGGSLAGANVAGGVPAPGPPPGPPPIVADPNQCPFCGQMKDAAGACACTVTKGAPPPVASGFGAPSGPATGGGPRLIGVAGSYMGHIFPINGTAVMGREATNPIPLDRDTTASRRHAQISDSGGSFYLQDLGSSNGTFLNGARVTEAALNPGDEVTVGGTRFRFEV